MISDWKRHRHLLVAVVAVAAVTACNDGTSPSGAALSTAQADSLAETFVMDASEIAEASAFNPSTGLNLSIATPPSALVAAVGPICTPTITPASPTNSDGDAVPDSIRVDFTGCAFTRGVMIHTLSGTIDIIDPTPTTTDYAARHVLTNFTRSLENTLTQRTVSARWNGTRQIEGTADTLGHTVTNMATDYTFANGATATHTLNWVARFQADVAGSIVLGDPLPAGVWTLTGTSTWAKGGLTWSVAVSTITALHFNPACAAEPQFDAGTLKLVVTRAGAISTVTVDFTACGQYTVTRT